ncbi:MAG: TolC family protein [Saprospiraceae bacterium]|nr:TolC family protein [Lewinella sp.]
MHPFKNIFFLLTVILTPALMQGQESTRLTLNDAIRLAQQQSIAARRAATRKTLSYWEWRSFQADLRPQVVLGGTLPGFTRTFQEVIQPTGTVDFQSVSNHNGVLDLSINQELPFTGGSLFVGTYLQRFDDFLFDKTLYNGAPVQVGYTQPLFQFNALRWQQKIAPLEYRESQQQFIADMEEIAIEGVDRFFDLLVASIDLEMAQSNRANTDTLYKIVLEKENLGKASRNDVLQARSEDLKARKAVAAAEQDYAASLQLLNAFFGGRPVEEWLPAEPDELPVLELSLEKALMEAGNNRPEYTAFQRRLLEGERDLAEAKGSTGFSADLTLGFGLSKSGPQLDDVYTRPQDQERIFLRFSLPILDWGRSSSRRERAVANQQLTIFEVQQDRQNAEQALITWITLLEMYRQQVDLNREADQIAADRYQIARDRFVLGNLSITELSIALQESVQAKRDYIQSLWNFWRTHYTVRALTLYDFENQEKIGYDGGQ